VLPAAGLDVHVLPGEADDVDEKAFGQPVLAHDADGQIAAEVGQLEVTIAFDPKQAVALHPRHGL
jgi:hypothetical protein